MKKILYFSLTALLILAVALSGCGGGGGNNPPGGGSSGVTVTTIAGGGANGITSGSNNGTGTSALFDYPFGIAINPSNGNIFVVDARNHKIRMITPATGQVVTIAGGGANGVTIGSPDDTTYNDTNSLFYYPSGIAIAADGSLYVTEGSNNIRKITPPSYQVSTIAYASTPSGIAIAAGSIYIVEYYNNRIRKITLSPFSSTIIAGGGADGATSGSNDGTGTSALFNDPHGIAIAADGSIYMTDSDNNKIRKINPITYQVTTIAGGGADGITSGSNDGTGTSALFNNPQGIAINTEDGSIYVAESGNHKIRKINPITYQVSTIAGGGSDGSTSGSNDGTGTSALFDNPFGIAIAPNGDIYVTDSRNNKIRRISFK